MSSSAQDLPLNLNLGNTFGALFIVVILGAVLVNSFLAMQSKLIFFVALHFTQQSLWRNQCSSFHLLSDTQ
jgi:hypothetical protein